MTVENSGRVRFGGQFITRKKKKRIWMWIECDDSFVVFSVALAMAT